MQVQAHTTPTLTLIATLTFPLALVPAAFAGDFVPTSQMRHAFAEASIDGGCGESDSAADGVAAEGFDPFDAEIILGTAVCGGSSTYDALAAQLSDFTPTGVSAAGSVLTGGTAGPSGAAGFGVAESLFEAEFFLTEDTPFELTGLLVLDVDEFSLEESFVGIVITGPGGEVFADGFDGGACGIGAPCELPISLSGVLPAGAYHVHGIARTTTSFADSFVTAVGHAGFELELTLTVPETCPADVTGDGIIGVEDLIAVVLAWGTPDPAADINEDGTVDVLDLVEVILGWGTC